MVATGNVRNLRDARQQLLGGVVAFRNPAGVGAYPANALSVVAHSSLPLVTVYTPVSFLRYRARGLGATRASLRNPRGDRRVSRSTSRRGDPTRGFSGGLCGTTGCDLSPRVRASLAASVPAGAIWSGCWVASRVTRAATLRLGPVAPGRGYWAAETPLSLPD